MHLPPHDYVLAGDGGLLLSMDGVRITRGDEKGECILLGRADENHVVMHATGLTDKSEDLIYDRDLVRYRDRVWEVRYERGGYYLFRQDDRPLELGVASSFEVFVLGNVYETPELKE